MTRNIVVSSMKTCGQQNIAVFKQSPKYVCRLGTHTHKHIQPTARQRMLVFRIKNALNVYFEIIKLYIICLNGCGTLELYDYTISTSEYVTLSLYSAGFCYLFI